MSQHAVLANDGARHFGVIAELAHQSPVAFNVAIFEPLSALGENLFRVWNIECPSGDFMSRTNRLAGDPS
jgi:hypothetical protein